MSWFRHERNLLPPLRHRYDPGMDKRKWEFLAGYLTFTVVVSRWLNVGPIPYVVFILLGVIIFFTTKFPDKPDEPDGSK